MRRTAVLGVVLGTLILVGSGSAAPRYETAPPWADYAPTWSADGKTIAFLRDTVGSWSVETVPAAGGTVRRVGPLPIDEPQESILPAAISPDLTKVAYQASRRLRIANADGSGIVDVPQSALSTPSWSSDGQSIVFGGFPTNVYVVRSDGSDLREVADGLLPSSSPDGTKIAFVLPYARGIGIVNRDGSGLHTLWESATFAGPPVWSPTGDLLAFASDYSLEVVRLDGSRVATFQGDFTSNGEPSWSADGAKLASSGGTGLSVFDLQSGLAKRFRYAGHAVWGPNPDLFAEVHSYPCSPPGIHVVSAVSAASRRLTLDCRIDGTRRSETLEGTEWSDVISGRRGADRIVGFGSDDRIFGGPGADRINGGPYANDDADYIDGGPGNDVLDGGRAQQSDYRTQDDELFGRSGRDVLRGGPGRDVLDGGPGNDTILARDGEPDEVNCGQGRDLARVDRRDHVARDCESVRRG